MVPRRGRGAISKWIDDNLYISIYQWARQLQNNAHMFFLSDNSNKKFSLHNIMSRSKGEALGVWAAVLTSTYLNEHNSIKIRDISIKIRDISIKMFDTRVDFPVPVQSVVDFINL